MKTKKERLLHFRGFLSRMFEQVLNFLDELINEFNEEDKEV